MTGICCSQAARPNATTKNCSHPSDSFRTNAMRFGVSSNDSTRRWKGFRALGRLGRTFALSDHGGMDATRAESADIERSGV
jgi:hypothetical protein